MALLTGQVDVVGFDHHGQPVLLAEVKGIRKTSSQWAARFGRNLLSHGTLLNAPFFLIATPQRMYFWRQDGFGPNEEQPDFPMDAVSELRPYFATLKIQPDRVWGPEMELIVLSWLTDLGESGPDRVKDDPSLRWMSESGLLDALKSARFELNRVQ